MRALTYDRYGTSDELRVVDRPTPKVGPGEVRIRVTRAAVNPVDWKVMSGGLDPLMDAHFPVIPGWDVAGVVDEVGPDTPEFAAGDRVAAYARKQIVSDGTFAEYVSVMADDVAAVPDAVTDDVAAALPLTGLTALRVLETLAVTKGDTLLVHAASGGVGSAAVQLGRAAGARVIGVVGGADKVTMARELGCDVVIDRREQDVIETVKEVTDGRGADVVYDPVGGSAFTQSTKCIAFEGRIIVVGFASGRVPEPRLNHALVKNYTILGLHWSLYQQHDPQSVLDAHAELVRLADAGQIAPLVAETYDFADTPAALARLAGGSSTGRIVITA